MLRTILVVSAQPLLVGALEVVGRHRELEPVGELTAPRRERLSAIRVSVGARLRMRISWARVADVEPSRLGRARAAGSPARRARRRWPASREAARTRADGAPTSRELSAAAPRLADCNERIAGEIVRHTRTGRREDEERAEECGRCHPVFDPPRPNTRRLAAKHGRRLAEISTVTSLGKWTRGGPLPILRQCLRPGTSVGSGRRRIVSGHKPRVPRGQPGLTVIIITLVSLGSVPRRGRPGSDQPALRNLRCRGTAQPSSSAVSTASRTGRTRPGR